LVPDLQKIKEEAQAALKGAKTPEELEGLRIKYLGRKGVLTLFMRKIGELPQEERPLAGKLANEIKRSLTQEIEEKKLRMEGQQVSAPFDLTLPGRKLCLGGLHPITKVLNEVTGIFTRLGFRVVQGNEIETDYYNFEALNMPPGHAARGMLDTFYLTKNRLLRSHTSPVQIHIMEKTKPPVRVISPGKVYRYEAVDASHLPMFHQVEGFMVDEGINFSHLKGVLEVFLNELFGKGTLIRFRPSFFPYTEPSAEVDISCLICKGKGCAVCKRTGWLEILGSGMIDPEVFKAVGYDPEKYTGFAFGVGIERIAMLKYNINDMRLFFENDLRFLRQF
jgi:phenylalanyl-tRNA synthetase alpha chain